MTGPDQPSSFKRALHPDGLISGVQGYEVISNDQQNTCYRTASWL